MFGLKKWFNEKFGNTKPEQVKQNGKQKRKPVIKQVEVQVAEVVEEVPVKEHKPKRRRNGYKRRASKKAVAAN